MDVRGQAEPLAPLRRARPALAPRSEAPGAAAPEPTRARRRDGGERRAWPGPLPRRSGHSHGPARPPPPSRRRGSAARSGGAGRAARTRHPGGRRAASGDADRAPTPLRGPLRGWAAVPAAAARAGGGPKGGDRADGEGRGADRLGHRGGTGRPLPHLKHAVPWGQGAANPCSPPHPAVGEETLAVLRQAGRTHYEAAHPLGRQLWARRIDGRKRAGKPRSVRQGGGSIPGGGGGEPVADSRRHHHPGSGLGRSRRAAPDALGSRRPFPRVRTARGVVPSRGGGSRRPAVFQ